MLRFNGDVDDFAAIGYIDVSCASESDVHSKFIVILDGILPMNCVV